ncbi:glutaminase [Dokdonella fugitiva]|jgi:glutaminase|uniref:Glutaminase n=1 Tax=Dokdonella fugitiva TaxID=328517 RepID=A0A4R2IFJ1_9GAMM|nr:glutaminase [Dokdonella fugitiva]MBA8883713.1 glutaminase [Dokdonella fugitiva]TCO41455.1 L-glutaminase [Dokdonella fugitiva]
MTLDLPTLLQDIAADVRPLLGEGEVASYIPALSRMPRDRFGIAVATIDGRVYGAGDSGHRFSIQSLSKMYALALALQREGDALWQRVGREPSGTPFNSLVQLERERGVPRNPFVNAGALVVTDVLCRRYLQPERAVLEFVHRLLGEADVAIDAEVARSERGHSDRNAAIAHFMRSFGNLHGDVGAVLDAYCAQCAIAMSCRELARAGLFLAADGVQPPGTRVVDALAARRINALMLTCGAYDAAGDLACRIGLPVKTGVGGGIVAVVPGRLCVCAWAPGLDANGNSIAAAAAIERFATAIGASIFAADASP